MSDFPLGCCWPQHMMSKDCTLFPLIDAFRLYKLLLHLCSKDWCNTTLLSIGWCFQILHQAAVSSQQRLVQCYSVEYWLMLSDSPSCCIFPAKIGAMLLCWVLADDSLRFCKLLHGCSKDGAICLSWLLADTSRFSELQFCNKISCNALLSIGGCLMILHSTSWQQRLLLVHLRLVFLRLL